MNLQTPHKLWFGQKADLSHLRVFGCLAYKLIPRQFRGSKFAPTSEKLILLGYQDRLHNYRLLNPSNNKVFYSHDVVFDESDFDHPNLSMNHLSELPDFLLEDLSDNLHTPLNTIISPELPDPPETECLTPTPIITDTTDSMPVPDATTPTTPVSNLKRKLWIDAPPPTPLSKEISSNINPRNIIEGH